MLMIMDVDAMVRFLILLTEKNMLTQVLKWLVLIISNLKIVTFLLKIWSDLTCHSAGHTALTRFYTMETLTRTSCCESVEWTCMCRWTVKTSQMLF